MAEGRLDQAEFADRLTTALSAKTASDLDPLFSDLPGPRPGQAVAPAADFKAPPWQPTAAVTPSRPTHLPQHPSWNRGLATISAVMWPITILLITFVLGWDNFWWLVFVPIVISSVLGADHQNRDRERDRIAREQRRLDERRRALGD